MNELSIQLSTGRLRLSSDRNYIKFLCDFAARANPKRGFLIVSKILGRHIPAAPSHMRQSMSVLASMLPADLPQPIAFLGMAETATALGQGVFAGYRAQHPDAHAIYLQTSRQRVAGARIIASFEEGHSHATTHLVQVADPIISQHAAKARTLVIIDDECSTGNTFKAAIEAMYAAMPELERVETCCITDWSGGIYRAELPLPTAAHAILHGKMDWEPTADAKAPSLEAGSNHPGTAPATGMGCRIGLLNPERADRARIEIQPGERVLVLGEGEHSYEALLVAEEIETFGGHAAVQCITRSPVLQGHAIKSKSRFTDSYGSGAPCFLYNILSHHPDLVIIVSEIDGNQITETRAALKELGSSIPVYQLSCTYSRNA